MRGRVVLLTILAVAIALVAVYVTGWSPSTPATPAAPSTPSLAPAQQGAAKPATSPGAKAAPKVSPPATTTPKAAPKPAGNVAPVQQPAAKPAPKPQPSTDPVRFGPVGDAGWDSETDVSEDRRALTATFADLQVGLQYEDAPDPSRSMGMTIPLDDGAEGETLYIHAQGYSFASDATAQLVLRARGRTIVQPFPAGTDDSFLTTLELPAVPGAAYELSAVLELEETSDAGGAAYLSILSIDAEIR
ncbi:MAG TPA: hypothetical protein VG499_00100 [Actinomycetota bacterium]|nr:hypothetical protein [Actinomycetota bacterium]